MTNTVRLMFCTAQFHYFYNHCSRIHLPHVEIHITIHHSPLNLKHGDDKKLWTGKNKLSWDTFNSSFGLWQWGCMYIQWIREPHSESVNHVCNKCSITCMYMHHCTCSVGNSVLMYSTALKSALSSGSWLGNTFKPENNQWIAGWCGYMKTTQNRFPHIYWQRTHSRQSWLSMAILWIHIV